MVSYIQRSPHSVVERLYFQLTCTFEGVLSMEVVLLWCPLFRGSYSFLSAAVVVKEMTRRVAWKGPL